MKKIFEKINVMSLFMLVACAIFGVADCGCVAAAGVAATTPAGSTVISGAPMTAPSEPQGLDTAQTAAHAPDLLQATIDAEIVKIRPAFTPLDTIMRSAKSKKAEGWKYDWYSTDLLPVESKVDTITAAAAANAAGVKDATLKVDDPALFNEGDTLCIATQADGNIILYVASVNPATNDMLVSYGGGDVPTDKIAADDKVYRLGRAAIEGEVQTINYAALPVKQTNYCQIFKWQVAESTLQKLHKKEVNWSMSDVEEQAMCEFKMAQEASFLFGRKCKYYNAVKKAEVYATGGITNYITKRAQFNKAATDKNAELVDLCKFIFQGNVGNRKRVMFMGSDFNAELSKVKMVQKQLASTETKVVWGVEFQEIRSNFGTLLCMQHDLLDLYGYADKAIVLDVDNLDKYIWTSDTLTLDTKHSGSFDGDVKVYTEVAGVALKYPDTHCIISLV